MVVDLPQNFQELPKSVLTYGLPDFSSAGGSVEDRGRLRLAVEQAIVDFEPRLREVRVTLHELEHEYDRDVRLTIDAVLRVEPHPLPISFDTVMMPSSGQCVVKSR
jgi:type VI secretion system protein ImpF